MALQTASSSANRVPKMSFGEYPSSAMTVATASMTTPISWTEEKQFTCQSSCCCKISANTVWTESLREVRIHTSQEKGGACSSPSVSDLLFQADTQVLDKIIYIWRS